MREFDREIREIKKQESESVAYMTYAMKIQEEREEAREEGKSEMVFRYIKKKRFLLMLLWMTWMFSISKGHSTQIDCNSC